MKKLTLFGVFLYCFFFTGCTNQQLGENESIYKGELVIAGIGPEISFEPTIDGGTLALKGSFEDHTNHIFINKGLWEKYFKNKSDYLPGNKVIFKGVVEILDGAAGNHYYNVKSIEKLEIKNYPNTDEIKNLFKGYNYCESDSDCGYFMGECPLGCYIPLNVKFIDTAHLIVSNFVNHLEKRCVYSCLSMNKAVCIDYKCEMVDATAEADVHGCSPLYKDHDFELKNPELACDDSIHNPVCANDGKTYVNDCYACIEPLVETYTFGECEKEIGNIACTPEQKSADICTMQYDPVCGNDGKTYGNDCVACQFETVESYTMGECENNLKVKYCTPEEKAADFCTMQYEPVCGSDSMTYGNNCIACQSETVESYTQGECESSAFTVEGDSEYLEEALNILNKNGAVTCDLFYTDYDRQVHSFFMADKDRFYSAIDNYSDNLQRNVIYTLAVDEKIYNWDTFTDSEKLVIDYPADIESEIASLLMDKSQYPDFEMNCYEGIDITNEHLFEALPK